MDHMAGDFFVVCGGIYAYGAVVFRDGMQLHLGVTGWGHHGHFGGIWLRPMVEWGCGDE